MKTKFLAAAVLAMGVLGAATAPGIRLGRWFGCGYGCNRNTCVQITVPYNALALLPRGRSVAYGPARPLRRLRPRLRGRLRPVHAVSVHGLGNPRPVLRLARAIPAARLTRCVPVTKTYSERADRSVQMR